MKRSLTRILTTHTGSLPRPEDLLGEVLAMGEGGPVDQAAFDRHVRAAVEEAVARQVGAGVDVVSDGEMSKVGFANYAKDRLTGFGGETAPFQARDIAEFPEIGQRLAGRESSRRMQRPTNTGPITYRPEAVQADIENLRAAVAGASIEEAFLPAVSPGCVAQVMPTEHFATRSDYLSALADALGQEYRAITDAGFVLQVDCPDLAMGRHVEFPDLPLEEYRDILRLHVEALNQALDGIDPEQVRVHVCWGNYPGPHHLDIPLRDIVDLVLQVRANGISVEAANPRHEHEWKVWESVTLPADRFLVPGVIDSIGTYIEHPEVVAQRLSRYTDVVGRERVVAGTDCGFGTFAGSSPVVAGVAYAKLAAMAEGARLVSAELW